MITKEKQLNAYQNAIKKEQDDLVLQYMPALKAMAFRLKERLPDSIDISDLHSIGVTQMIILSKKYDVSKNDSFWGYAQKRVYGAMLDYLRSLDVMSKQNRTLFKQIQNQIDIFFNNNQVEPSDEELSNIMNIDIKKIRELRNADKIYSVLPFNEQLDLVQDSQIEKIIEKEDLLKKIEKILTKFEKRDQLLIQLYYYEELNFKEIAQILNISESRISQLHTNLIAKIRQNLDK